MSRFAFSELVNLAQAHDPAFEAISRAKCIESARDFVAEEHAAIRERHQQDESGGNVVRLLSDMADTLVAGVFAFALYHVPKPKVVEKKTALCAHGGYGRMELNPESDLDIGLVYEGRLDKNIRALNEYMVPFLWDVGLENSLVVRNVKEAVALAKEDTKVFTSYLSCRRLLGSERLYGKLRLALDALRPGDTARRVAELKLRERSDALGPQERELYAPEPNIKDGAGGLRDYHTALWLYTLAYQTSSLDEIAGRGLISPEERLDLAKALDLIWRIRNDLHFRAEKCDDRLTFENEERVAIAFGYTDEDERDTTRFMRDYYRAARTLRRFLRTAARTCKIGGVSNLLEAPRPEPAEYTVEDGELFAGMTDPHWFEESPSRMMGVFWECARRDVRLSHQTETLIRANLDLVGDTFQTNDLVRRIFLAICNRPRQAGRVFRQMAHAGVLQRYLPEFAEVEDTICYEDFHHYPVGEHTLRAVEALAEVPELAGPAGQFLKVAIEHLTDPHILVLALLLHDLGKVEGEEHSEAGMRLASDICARVGIPDEDAEGVAFLVRHHLLMTHTALYRDTDDSDVIQQFAKVMKSDSRLRALFLLSYADLSAVAPNVWNEWKGALLLKLYLRTEKVLLGRAESVDEEFWKNPKADRTRELVAEDMKSGVELHLRAFGERYFSAFSPEQIALHIDCLHDADQNGFAVRTVTSVDTDTSELVVCTLDRPGLFQEIAGCFASQLIDVERSALFTRPDGMALDCFTVVSASRKRPLTHAQANVVEHVLRHVLHGDESVEEHLERSQRRVFALLNRPAPVRTRIAFDNDSSKTYTVIDVVTGDRTGLLYDLAKAMHEAGLDVASARIVTDARRVRDSFYVTLRDKKIVEPELQADLRGALEEAIYPRTKAETKGGQ